MYPAAGAIRKTDELQQSRQRNDPPRRNRLERFGGRPVRLSMRTALTEYTVAELLSELYRRGTRPYEDQSAGVTVPRA